eukprot:m.114567 g.114567  ORF g.114567 m.114567 type:complete len:52 (-) comp16028_c0_seq3:1230-1385(-)
MQRTPNAHDMALMMSFKATYVPAAEPTTPNTMSKMSVALRAGESSLPIAFR